MTTRRAPNPRTVIDELVAGLAPVRPRQLWRDALLLGAVMLGELVVVMMLAPPRADLMVAMTGPMFWWKALGCAGLAAAGATTLLALLTPEARPGAGRRTLLGALALALIAGAVLIGASDAPIRDVMRNWRDGLHCLIAVELYALPVWLTALLIARRSAPARPQAAAWAAGIAGAAWGAVAFAWSCPHDEVLYVLVWYGLAVALGAGVTATVTTRWLRW